MSNSKSTLKTPTFQQNDRVEAYWLEDSKWYPATVLKVVRNNLFRIRFDDVEKKAGREYGSHDLRKKGAAPPADSAKEAAAAPVCAPAQAEAAKEAAPAPASAPASAPPPVASTKEGGSSNGKVSNQQSSPAPARAPATTLNQAAPVFVARSSRTEAQRIVEDFWKSVELPSRAGDDYYAALDLAPDSCKRDIEKKFRDLSLEWHPDKLDRRCLKLVPEDAEGRSEVLALLRETFAPIHEKEFRILSEAKDVLTDEEKRAEYDAERNAPADPLQAFFNSANFPANFSFPSGKSGSFSFTFSSSAQTPRAKKKPEPKFRQKQGSRV